LNIFDIVGDYKFMSVQKSYMEKVDLIMVCYDVSDDKAFHTIDK